MMTSLYCSQSSILYPLCFLICLCECYQKTPANRVSMFTNVPSVQSLSIVRLFETPWTIAQPGSSPQGILQARLLEWVAMSSSRGSSWPRDGTHVSCTGSLILYHWATRPERNIFFSSSSQGRHLFFFFFFLFFGLAIYKVFIEFLTMLFLLSIFCFFGHKSCENLVPGIAQPLHWEKKP